MTCSAQGIAPLATSPDQLPLASVVTDSVKVLPSAQIAVTVPSVMAAPMAAVPVRDCVVAGASGVGVEGVG